MARTSIKWQINNAISIAKQLYYPAKVVKQLKAAKTENEISKILISARHACE